MTEQKETEQKETDRATVEEASEGSDREDLLDALFRLWIALATGQGRGRRLAFRLLEPRPVRSASPCGGNPRIPR